MVCRNCGQKCGTTFCARCGIQLRKTAQLPLIQRRPLRLKNVIWQGIAMLLPLVYLIVDLFVLLNDKLLVLDERGVSAMARLFDYLSSPAYGTNTTAELVEGTLGSGEALIATFKPFALLGQGGPFVLGTLVFLALILLSAAMGVLLIVSRGNLLANRIMASLCLFGGLGAAFAPLAAMLLVRIAYAMGGGAAAADLAMTRVSLSVEAILLMTFLWLVLLPAMRSVQALAARLDGKERELFVSYPYYFAYKMPFKGLKITLLSLIGGGMVLAVLYFFTPISTMGGFGDLSAAWLSLSADLTAFCKSIWALIADGGGMPNFQSLAASILKVSFFLQIPWLIYAFLKVLVSFIRACRIRYGTLEDRRCDRKTLQVLPVRMRKMLLTPWFAYVGLQAIVALVLLFATPVAGHLDFDNVQSTLGVIYLTLARAKALCGTTTLYAILALVGAPLWHTAAQMGRLMMIQSDEK